MDNADADVYSYYFSELMQLKYKDGIVIGSPDEFYASKIVGDKEGFTKIYEHNSDITERYMPKIMAYMNDPKFSFIWTRNNQNNKNTTDEA